MRQLYTIRVREPKSVDALPTWMTEHPNFKLHQFDHSAFYNAPEQRIEMHLISNCRQTVRVGEVVFSFEAGESLHTENSYKFSIDGLQRLAQRAGLQPGPVWTDPQHWFCLQWLDIPASKETP